MDKQLKQTELDLDLIKNVFENNQNLPYQIFEHMPIGICVTNEKGIFTDVNEAYCKLYNYKKNELIGKSFLMMVPEENHKKLSKLHMDFIENKREIQGRWKVKDSQGHPFEILTNAAHLKNKNDGSVKKMTFVVRAEEIGDSLKQLRETIKLLDRKIEVQDFAINLAEHDMRNNLGSIISIASILENSGPTKGQLKWIKMIKEIGLDTLDLLKASKDYAKMEIKSYEPEISEFDLIAVIDKELKIFKDSIAANNLIIQLKYNGQKKYFEDFKFEMRGDQFYIHRLFNNLVCNAIQASRSEKIIELCINDQTDFKITLHNDGKVPQEIGDHFFEKYITYGKQDGTGLGTYIAKMITKLHGGDISFTTHESDGTQITLHFPKEMVVAH